MGDQFSLEKCAFLMLQMLENVYILQSINVFPYLDLTLESLVVNNKYQMLFKTPLTETFKFFSVSNDRENLEM